MKRCRICNQIVRAGERYCSPAHRLEALGREDVVITKDAKNGWQNVIKTVRQPWPKS